MKRKNTYILDPESESEMARLMRQGRLLTNQIGLFPPSAEALFLDERIGPLRILDVGCAVGDWGLEIAAKFRDVAFLGLDISQRMIDYASMEAESRNLGNARFQVGSVLEPLAFPDGSFHIVNLRLGVGFVPRQMWPQVLQECRRVLAPDGMFIWTEGEMGVVTSSSPATGKINQWLCQALWYSGLGFWSGSGSLHGIHAMQPVFLADAGLKDCRTYPAIVYASYGSQQWQEWLDHLVVTVKAIKPLICGPLGISSDEFDATMQESLLEAGQEDYRCYSNFLVVTGRT